MVLIVEEKDDSIIRAEEEKIRIMGLVKNCHPKMRVSYDAKQYVGVQKSTDTYRRGEGPL